MIEQSNIESIVSQVSSRITDPRYREPLLVGLSVTLVGNGHQLKRNFFMRNYSV